MSTCDAHQSWRLLLAAAKSVLSVDLTVGLLGRRLFVDPHVARRAALERLDEMDRDAAVEAQERAKLRAQFMEQLRTPRAEFEADAPPDLTRGGVAERSRDQEKP